MITNFLGSVVVLPIITAAQTIQAIPPSEIYSKEYIFSYLLIAFYYIIKFGLVIAGAIVLAFNYKRYIYLKKGIDPIPKSKTAMIIFKNPGFIAFAVVSTVEFILSLI